jgi:hypothetical protein
MNEIALPKRYFDVDKLGYYRSEAARCRALGAATPFSHVKRSFLELAAHWDAMAVHEASDAEAEQLAARIVEKTKKHVA